MNKEIIGFYGGKMFPFHMGHLHNIIRASNMVDKLYVIVFSDEKTEKELCKNTKIKYEQITPRKRLEWISKSIKGMEHVKVFNISEGYGSWSEEAVGVRKIIGKNPNVVFSAEPSYDPIFKELYPNAKHIIFDKNIVPISATMIRNEGAIKYWDYLPKSVQNDFVKKVVIVGTESCGKSTLTRNLAKAFNTSYVHEYGRDICEEFNGCDGILPDEIYPTIAYGHKMLEKKQQEIANKLLFIDSEAIITQFYSNLYNNKNQTVIEEIIKLQDYDLWIFLEPDVKWVDDGYRVHGDSDLRNQNNLKLKKMLEERNIKYTSIDGDYNNRFDKAFNLCLNLLKD